MEKWYLLSLEQTENALQTNAARGLTPKAAYVRSKQVPRVNSRGERLAGIYHLHKIFSAKNMLSAVGDLTVILLLVTIIVVALLGDGAQAQGMTMILAANCILSLMTYFFAQRILEELSEYSLPQSRVIRNGKVILLACRHIVPGDVILLSGGDVLPCDARLAAAANLRMMENGITENTGIVEKKVEFPHRGNLLPEEQLNMLFAGTTVVGGEGRAIAVACGADTLAVAKTGGLTLADKDKLDVLEQLKRYCRVWGLTMMAIAFAIMLLDLFMQGRDIIDTFVAGISLTVASMSGFFAGMGSIIIACSAVGAARRAGGLRRGAVMKNVAAFAPLAETGCVILKSASALRSGEYALDALYVHRQRIAPQALGAQDKLLLGLAAFTASGQKETSLALQSPEADEEDRIMLSIASRYGAKSDARLLARRGVSRTNPLATALVLSEGTCYAVVRGALPLLLSQCVTYSTEKGERELSTRSRTDILAAAEPFAGQACRIIAVAHRVSPYTTLDRTSVVQTSLCFDGFFAVRELLSPGTEEVIRQCHDGKIKLIMLTDDGTDNDLRFAVHYGIAESADAAVDGAMLRHMDETAAKRCYQTHSVFRGLSAQQRLSLISAWQENGCRVTYIGDDMMDTAMLHQADAGIICAQSEADRRKKRGWIAMDTLNIHDAQNAKMAADVVIPRAGKHGGGLLDAAQAILYAKASFFNLRRAASYLMTTQIARLLTVLFSVLTRHTLVNAVQILFLGLLLDFAAVLAIAFQKPRLQELKRTDDTGHVRLSRREKLNALIFGMLWAALSIGLPIIVALAEGTDLPRGIVFVSSLAMSVVVLAEHLSETTLFRRVPVDNRMFYGFVLICGLLFVLCTLVPAISSIFSVDALSMTYVAAATVPALVLLGLYELFKWLGKSGK